MSLLSLMITKREELADVYKRQLQAQLELTITGALKHGQPERHQTPDQIRQKHVPDHQGLSLIHI